MDNSQHLAEATSPYRKQGHADMDQFRIFVAGVTDYAIYMLSPEGYVSSWNAGAQRFKGYTAEEIIGQHFSRFYTKEDRIAGVPVKALNTALEQGKFEAEGWRVRKDGTRFWASIVIDPIYDNDGKLFGFAKVTRDITERREAALALDAPRRRCSSRRSWRSSANLPAALRTTSTTCLPSSSADWNCFRGKCKARPHRRCSTAWSVPPHAAPP